MYPVPPAISSGTIQGRNEGDKKTLPSLEVNHVTINKEREKGYIMLYLPYEEYPIKHTHS